MVVTVVGVVTAGAGLSPARTWIAGPPGGPAASSVAGLPVPPPAPGALARLAVAGDTGTGDDAERRTAQVMAAQEVAAGPFAGLLLLGDLVYDDGDPGRVPATVTGPFAAVLRQDTALLPVLGNHDYGRGQAGAIMTALGRSTAWYEQQVGPLRVVVLDSNQVDEPAQTTWLRATLAEPTPPGTWTVVAMHHPAYSAGHHGSDLQVQRHWSPLFAQHRVPLVLAGHDHDYQRSTPQGGVTYLVSGAGAKTRPTGRQPFTAVSTSTRHFLDLLAYPDRLVVRAIDQSGRLLDTVTLPRP